jgi:hypothetical protein
MLSPNLLQDRKRGQLLASDEAAFNAALERFPDELYCCNRLREIGA